MSMDLVNLYENIHLVPIRSTSEAVRSFEKGCADAYEEAFPRIVKPDISSSQGEHLGYRQYGSNSIPVLLLNARVNGEELVTGLRYYDTLLRSTHRSFTIFTHNHEEQFNIVACDMPDIRVGQTRPRHINHQMSSSMIHRGYVHIPSMGLVVNGAIHAVPSRHIKDAMLRTQPIPGIVISNRGWNGQNHVASVVLGDHVPDDPEAEFPFVISDQSLTSRECRLFMLIHKQSYSGDFQAEVRISAPLRGRHHLLIQQGVLIRITSTTLAKFVRMSHQLPNGAEYITAYA